METNHDRVASRDSVVSAIERAFADWPAIALLERLAQLGIPAGKVRTLDEVYQWEQTRSQGLLIDVEHETLGTIAVPGPPLRFFDTAGGETTRTAHRAPPVLDSSADAVRAWLAGSP